MISAIANALLLARAEFERLAETEWQKLGLSKDERALRSFCMHFPGTPQIQLARSLIADLVASSTAAQPSSSVPISGGEVAAFINRHPLKTALIWLFMCYPLTYVPGVVFATQGWHFIKFFSNERDNSGINGICLGVLIIATLAFYLMRSRGEALHAVEGVIYWLGCAVPAGILASFFWVLLKSPAIDSPNPSDTAFLVWLCFLFASGIAAMVWWKLRQMRRLPPPTTVDKV